MTELRAGIDIGTNTTHLIIGRVTKSGSDMVRVATKRHYIFLAESGIDKISDQAISRLLDALEDFKSIIQKNSNPPIRITATEALRIASNGKAIVEKVLNQFGWKVNVISGREEAQLVLKAVQSVIDLSKGHFVIMDIGGGSTEFIQVLNGRVLSIFSLPAGIGRMFNQFHHSEPISQKDLNNLRVFLENQFRTLKKAIDDIRKPATLIGCAGSFEIFEHYEESEKAKQPSFHVKEENFTSFYRQSIHLDLEARQKAPWIPSERAPYIPVSLELIKYALQITSSKGFMVSRFALKEGIILD